MDKWNRTYIPRSLLGTGTRTRDVPNTTVEGDLQVFRTNKETWNLLVDTPTLIISVLRDTTVIYIYWRKP